MHFKSQYTASLHHPYYIHLLLMKTKVYISSAACINFATQLTHCKTTYHTKAHVITVNVRVITLWLKISCMDTIKHVITVNVRVITLLLKISCMDTIKLDRALSCMGKGAKVLRHFKRSSNVSNVAMTTFRSESVRTVAAKLSKVVFISISRSSACG